MRFNIRGLSLCPILLVLLLIFSASGCSSIPKKSFPELNVVPYVDIDRYLGKWYEIALYPNWFEKGCFSSTAFYEKLENNKIKVTNQCRMYSRDGDLNEAVGTAFITDRKSNAKLKVQFFWPFKGDYWIVELDSDYKYAVVSEPGRQYLWILSRTPEIEPKKLLALKERIKEKGFDLNYLVLTQN